MGRPVTDLGSEGSVVAEAPRGALFAQQAIFALTLFECDRVESAKGSHTVRAAAAAACSLL